MVANGWDEMRVAAIQAPRDDRLSDDDRRWWLAEIAEPLRCEVRSLEHRCPEPATFVLTFRGKKGYICTHDLAAQLVSMTRFGPVLVEKLP